MYAWPVLIRPFSNREDLLLTTSLFDDDTGQAIEVSGRTLAKPGDFTANAWTVTASGIVTNSVTQLTIKDFPIQNEMLAVALTVGLNLGIVAGGNVTIQDTATGLNTMSGYVTSYAPLTGALVCQIGWSFEFEIRGSLRHDDYDDGYSSSWDIGTASCDQPLISAQLGNGLSIVDIGTVQIRIPALTMQTLRHRTYKASMTATDSYDTRQLFTGKLPIIGGGVNRVPTSTNQSTNPFGLP